MLETSINILPEKLVFFKSKKGYVRIKSLIRDAFWD